MNGMCWMVAVLSWFLQSDDDDRDRTARFFQVLEVEPKILEPATFTEDYDEDVGPVLFQVAVQAYEHWRPLVDHPQRLCNAVDMFAFEEPSTIDVLRMCGCSPQSRFFFAVAARGVCH